jgi:Fumarylacetoacetate (FAA) hydrolase family
MPGNSGGQFFYAKAFDKFAPIGPTLLSPELFAGGKGLELITRVNGQVMQKSEFVKEFVFSPTEILSHMSQGWSLSILLACFPVSPNIPACDTKTREEKPELTERNFESRNHHSSRHCGHDRNTRRSWRIPVTPAVPRTQ